MTHFVKAEQNSFTAILSFIMEELDERYALLQCVKYVSQTNGDH